MYIHTNIYIYRYIKILYRIYSIGYAVSTFFLCTVHFAAVTMTINGTNEGLSKTFSPSLTVLTYL